MKSKHPDLKNLQSIPGVGPKLSMELWRLGFRRVSDLKNQHPDMMYEQLMELHQMHIDRCVLYVFRCAVYFAETETPEPEKTNWWYWKNHTINEGSKNAC